MHLMDLFIPIEPVPWQRVFPFQGRLVTPKETRAFQRTVGRLAKYAMGNRAAFKTPLAVRVLFKLQQPDKFRKRPFPDVKMDIDNLTKNLFDGLNGIIWDDDGRIVEIRIEKIWSTFGAGSISLRVFEAEVK